MESSTNSPNLRLHSVDRTPLMARVGFPIDWEELRESFLAFLGMLRPTATAISLLFALSFIYFYASHEMRFFAVTTGSMQPTIAVDDCVVTIASAEYLRGDVIVFRDPVNPGQYLAKRIVGIGGDEVLIKSGLLHINGKPVDEPYLAEPMNYNMSPFRVPRGQLFVLGDNRNASDDSFTWWRAVPLTEVRGRVVQIYLPFERIQRVAGAKGRDKGMVFQSPMLVGASHLE